jgi:enoyl-CoA hydratase
MNRADVRIEVEGPVCTIILDRPDKRNAVDPAMAAALSDAFAEFEGNRGLRVAVLWGAGGHFCSGGDLATLTDPQLRGSLDPRGTGPMGPSRLALSKPLIAAVSGFAVAGGLELALLADLRIAERDAVFGVFCRRWGVPLVDGGTARLPRLIGIGRALDMILTGRAK